MTDARQTPEEQLLKHYREQHDAEPPAHLDAFDPRRLPAATPRYRNQACGNAGSTPAANRAGKSRSPASSAWL